MEALGRNPQLETLGYFGKQAYWIRCGSCVDREQRGATARSPTLQMGAGSENERQGVQEGDTEAGGRDRDDVNMSGGRRREQGAAEPEELDQSESESESDSEPERERKPEPMPFAVALTLLQEHPAAKVAFLQPRYDFTIVFFFRCFLWLCYLRNVSEPRELVLPVYLHR